MTGANGSLTTDVSVLARRVATSVSEDLLEARGNGSAPDHSAERVLGRKLILDYIGAMARQRMSLGQPVLAPDVEDRIERAVYDRLFGFAGFQRYLDDDSIENIHANGCDNVWVVRADGSREQVDAVADTDADLVELVRQFAARTGRTERRFDAGNPFVNLRLPDGSRLFAAMEVSERVCVSIRRHRLRAPTLESLMAEGTLDHGLWSFLSAAVKARRNIVIAGGTDAGKTTLMRAMINEIDRDERLVVIEDSLELNLSEQREAHPNIVEFEQREPNIEGEGGITMRHLTAHGLRMAPDRVIVGEVRGAEVVDMLLAMMQGNDGSLCTLHSESSSGAFSRMFMYAMLGPERFAPEITCQLVSTAVHFVVYVRKLRDGTRAISSVREVCGAEGSQVLSNEVFAPGPDGRARPSAPLRDSTVDLLVEHGFHETVMHNPAGRWST